MYYYLQSDPFQKQIRAITAGLAQQKVNLKKFRQLRLKMPSKAEQREVVAQIKNVLELVDPIERGVSYSSNKVSSLTQSILARAFRGELVPQDADDEPASVLLERIHKEVKEYGRK